MSRFKEEGTGTGTGTGSRLQNGESASPNSTVDMHAEAASSNSFKPHLVEQVYFSAFFSRIIIGLLSNSDCMCGSY